MLELMFGSLLSFALVALFLFCWPAAYIAGQKNRSMLTWFFAGMLFGPMAVLMVGFSPALPPEGHASSTPPLAPPAQPGAYAATSPPAQNTAPAARPKPFCPSCGESLAADAVFCQGCGRKAC